MNHTPVSARCAEEPSADIANKHQLMHDYKKDIAVALHDVFPDVPVKWFADNLKANPRRKRKPAPKPKNK